MEFYPVALWPVRTLRVTTLSGRALLTDGKVANKYFKKIWSVAAPKKNKTTRLDRVRNLIAGIPWEIADEYNAELKKTLGDILSQYSF